MGNSRRKTVMLFVLIISMILSGCDNGGNDTNKGGNIMEKSINVENQAVEPKAVDLLVQSITGTRDATSTFRAISGNGKYVRLAIASYNDATFNVIVYINSKRNKTYVLSEKNPSLIEVFPINANSDFRIVYEVTNGKNMSVHVIARQYENKPTREN